MTTLEIYRVLKAWKSGQRTWLYECHKKALDSYIKISKAAEKCWPLDHFKVSYQQLNSDGTWRTIYRSGTLK